MPSQITQIQRFLSTEFISKRRLNVPAVWLKPEGLVPSVEDTVADSLNTDLGAWDEQNLGVRLVDGHVELRLDTPDDVWAHCLFKAFRFLAVDARTAFGVHHVTSIIIHVDEPETIERWTHRWPKGHVDHQGRKVKTEISLFERADADVEGDLSHQRAVAGLDHGWRNGVLAAVWQAAGRYDRAGSRGSRIPPARRDSNGIDLPRHRLRHALVLGPD